MFIKTADKWEAISAFINTWLKDRALYCNNCGFPFVACCEKPRIAFMELERPEEIKENDVVVEVRKKIIRTWGCRNCWEEFNPCCDNPQIGMNKDHVKGVIEQNKIRRRTRANEHASNKTKTMRWAVSLPTKLYQDLNRYCQTSGQQKLFENPEEMREFARRFKVFAIPERI